MIFWSGILPMYIWVYSLTGSHRLKSFNRPGHIVYTVGQINTYPFGIYGLQIVTSKLPSYLYDS